MLTLKAFSSGWTPAHDAYNGSANFSVSRPGVREHFCNCCATRISIDYHADVRPSGALTGGVLRICDLPTCRPEVAGPVDTSAFSGTDSHNLLDRRRGITTSYLWLLHCHGADRHSWRSKKSSGSLIAP